MKKKNDRPAPRAFSCRRLFLTACIALGLLCSLPIILTSSEMHWLIDHNIRHFNITAEPARKESDIIAFICKYIGESKDHAIYTIRPDGSQLRQILTQPRRHYRELSWSPDGIWLAMVVSYIDMPVGRLEKDEIFRVRFDGLDPRRLTYNRSEEFAPRWSSDGKSILFLRRDTIYKISSDGHEISQTYNRYIFRGFGGRPTFDLSSDGQKFIAIGYYDALLYGTRLNGADWRVLTRAGTHLAAVAWAPNNDQIMYYTFDPNYDFQKLAVFNVNEQVEDFSLEMDTVWDAQWSPDGKWIAILGNTENVESGIYLYLLDVQTSDIHRVTNDDIDLDNSISWSPDSEWIAFSNYEYSFGDEDKYISRMFKIRRDGAGLQQLTDIDCLIDEISWSPK